MKPVLMKPVLILLTACCISVAVAPKAKHRRVRRKLTAGSACTAGGSACGLGLECVCSGGRRLFGAPAATFDTPAPTCACQIAPSPPPPPSPSPAPPAPPLAPPPPDYVVFNGGVHSNLDVSVAGEVSRPGTGISWGSSAYTTSPNVITANSMRRGISFKCYPGNSPGQPDVCQGCGRHAMVTIRNPEPSSASAITEGSPATASSYGIFCRPNGQADHMVGTCRYGSCTTLARTTSNPYTSNDVFTVRVPSAGTVEWLVNGVVTNTVTGQGIAYPLYVNVEIHGSTVYDIVWV